MSLEKKIQEFLIRAVTKPALSKLDPYRDLIRSLRQRRWTYAEIAVALRDEFGVRVAPSTIHSFVKVRAKDKGGPSLDAISPPIKGPQTKKPRFNLDA